MKRQIYLVRKTGSLNNLNLEDDDLLAPSPDEVQIEVRSIGLNYADIFAVMGLYSATPKGQFIPGLEYSGTVIKTGENVKTLKSGDKIMGVTRFGGYTTHLNIDHRYVFKLKEEWAFQQGAAYPVQVLTAYYALKDLGNIQKNQTILIHSAAGGVGLLANKIAKKFDCYTIGVVGSAEKIPVLKDNRFDAAIIRSENFRNDLKTALDGKELNLVLEATGGKFFNMSYEALAPQGRLVAYGSAEFTPSGNAPSYPKLIWKYLSRPKIDPLKMISENKSVMAFNLIWIYHKAEIMKRMMSELDSLNLEPPMVGHQYNFIDLPEAIKFFKTGKTVGKVIVNV